MVGAMTHSHHRHAGHLVQRVVVLTATLGLLCGLTATPAGASSSSKVAQAKKLLLVLSDMPKGWSKQKGSNNNGSNSFPGAKQLAACIGVPASLIESNPPTAYSPTYQNKGDTQEVQDSVAVFSSAKVAKAQLAAIANAKTPACFAILMNSATFRKEMQASAGKGATVGTISVTAIDAADFPKGSAGFVLTLPVTEEGISLKAHFIVVYAVKGAFGQQVEFNSYGPAFPASIATSLTSVAVHRL
jgi:hypothetical protein